MVEGFAREDTADGGVQAEGFVEAGAEVGAGVELGAHDDGGDGGEGAVDFGAEKGEGGRIVEEVEYCGGDGCGHGVVACRVQWLVRGEVLFLLS